MSRHNQWVGYATGLLLTAAAVSEQGCKSSAASTTKSATPVRVETVGRADMADVLTYVADLKPYIEVKMFSPVPDRILYFPWKDGDEIRAGERVAMIRREGLEKGIEQMVAQMEALDVQIKNLESEQARSKDLQAAGVITRQVYDQVQTSYLSALAQRKALEASKGQIAVSAGNALLTAPFAGVIANKMLETGDMAVPQMPLCRILQVDKLKATLRLAEIDVPKVRIGQEVVLHFDAYPGRTFSGRVANILPYLDAGTRTNTVEVVIDNPKEGGESCDGKCGQRPLKPGMFGLAAITVDKRSQVVAAPEPALLLDNRIIEQQKQGEALRKAFVVDEASVAHERVVTLGSRQGSMQEVVKGLEAGERIVTRGHHRLKDGDTVEVVAAN